MATKIGKKIKAFSVSTGEPQAAAPTAPPATVESAPAAIEAPRADVIQMHERVERPEVLVGSTYKVKSPLFEHALYVTINDIVLNPGTRHESRRPFEIFVNSKNMDHFQWVVAITRIMSAVFRKGGDVTFLVEELKAVFDPRGGYFKAGGVYMPSIVAEIGAVVEDHLKSIGMILDDNLTPEQHALIAEKRAAYEANLKKNADVGAASASTAAAAKAAASSAAKPAAAEASGYPPGATMCHKCSTQAVIVMDGCQTCLACGYSKCG